MKPRKKMSKINDLHTRLLHPLELSSPISRGYERAEREVQRKNEKGELKDEINRINLYTLPFSLLSIWLRCNNSFGNSFIF